MLTIVQSTRPPFLILTPCCVFLGLCVAIAEHTQIDWLVFSTVLIGAVSAHVSVNTLNEYFDFKSGLDQHTVKTKFSGGSGALLAQPEMVNAVLAVGIISLLITAVIGVLLALYVGVGIIPLGLAGLFIIILYTPWINRNPWLCLIAPGTGFGILMVMGTHYVLTGNFTWLSLLVSLIPFFLVNNLLLLNQYPDISADMQVGRRHFPIAYGVTNSNIMYGLFTLLALLTIIGMIWNQYLPALGLITLLPMLLAGYALFGAITCREEIGRYTAYMAANVSASLLSPVLLGISLIF